MAKRLQRGSLQKLRRGKRLIWMGFYYDQQGTRRAKTLGTATALTKTQAQEQLDLLVRPVNEQRSVAPATFANFVNDIVLPAKRRQWKASTQQTTEERVQRILIPRFRTTRLADITRTVLQEFLDQLARDGTSWSIVAHTRWDLSMIMKFAHNEGLINRNPAALLHIPDAPTKERHVLTIEQATLLFTSFTVRERLIIKLCGIAGIRPGETMATKWSDLSEKGLRITRRVYRGKIDTPKSKKGNRIAALSTSIMTDLLEWRNTSPNAADDDWIFASENGQTPLWPTNVWYDKIRPTLQTLSLEWVNYQVLRRSAATLMNQLGIEGKTVSDQLGHHLNVSQNIYTQSGIKQQTDAVEKLDQALRKPERTTTMTLPTGLSYLPEFLNTNEQDVLLAQLQALTYQHDTFRGQKLKRSYAQFGYAYQSTGRKLLTAPPLPAFLVAIAEKAIPHCPQGTRFNQCIITHYPQSAGIGWHTDAPVFGDVIIALSLGAPARLQLRRNDTETTEYDLAITPGSLYLMHGMTRWAYEHQITPVKTDRYSITFRQVPATTNS